MTADIYGVDRSSWPAGPWDFEAEDRLEWRDAATRLPCLMVRNGRGAWCGYVGMPPGHPLHGVSYHDARDQDGAWIDEAHGGLTYSAACDGHICHVPQPGEPEDAWWLGFDCGHAGDHVPALASTSYGRYRDVAYVKEKVTRLAQILVDGKPDAARWDVPCPG